MSNEQSSSQFEKNALTILAMVIVSVLGWVGYTVNQNQIQYARIDERLAAQSDILKDMQIRIGDANQWRAGVDQDLSDIKARLNRLEKSN
ncbi:hypothetical protein [Pseudoalteromonas peptidolytica]|uniref:Uncharacterized protein n=1 Tax=Pseudoalteromonas peptidolytica F12-50-A1 TaxID=1315280 RepID=A0A8I0T6C0_9GAMM|nr:hypothetical protein [Pseudoalteromonas peptidolytica]MBE0348272.1 hypothetical protein [Pseudoalteromonas peptidolytica F12-50-A1]NLR16557.1 hypothetical protein [Pseudoalteromonas peptidolytica]GEK08928.1 hypothetical protein PPE03_11770 [Pseudoalteromonas peptidolytica]